jgi:glycosyltransferase involved in cell wall biosynthesis
VAPLRFGAGIQNKVLEAMAMQVPSIVTPVVAEGIRDEAGHAAPVHVAATAEAFAARVLELLRAAEDAPAPDAAARRFVEQNFSWRRSGEKLEQLLASVAETSPTTARA